MRCGDSTSFAMSGFSRWICSTIEPIGSSTSGIQMSSSSGMPGLLLLLPGAPGDLPGCEEEQNGKEPPKRGFRQRFGHLGAPERRPDRRDPHEQRRAPADVAVLLMPPDADEDGRDDREQRGRLGVPLCQAEVGQRREEEDAAADAEHPGEHSGDDAEHDRERDRHRTSMSTAMATSSSAKAYESVRTGTRCCSVEPA